MGTQQTNPAFASHRQIKNRLPEALTFGIVRELPFLQRQVGFIYMQEQQQVDRLKVDSSGRVALPVEARDRHHIAHGERRSSRRR